MDKNELIVKQQLEIEQLKLEIKDIKLSLKPVLNSSIHLQQYSEEYEDFTKIGMLLAIDCSKVLSEIIREK